MTAQEMLADLSAIIDRKNEEIARLKDVERSYSELSVKAAKLRDVYYMRGGIMDGTKILKTFATMVNMGITEITISERGYYDIEAELLKWCTHTTNEKGKTTICGIDIRIKVE